MSTNTLHERLYLANAAVLLVHQMDAAYQHEWTLFGMPGGLALYLALNVPIALAVLAGYGAVAANRPAAVPLSALLVLSGLFAGAFHAFHLARGDPAFRAPASLRCSRLRPSCRSRRAPASPRCAGPGPHPRPDTAERGPLMTQPIPAADPAIALGAPA